jgi:tRNA(Ile)-lysidine synthase TilS/MesJ
VASVFFRTKLGTTEELTAAPGQPLTDVLRRHGIPVNAVLTWRNGSIVAEETTAVGASDVIEVRQVRHYDLDVLRRPRRQTYGAPSPVYAKTVLFDSNGAIELRTEQLDGPGFINYVEETFAQSVLSHDVMRAGDKVVVGLSGGRDSVAYLTLLERTRDRLPAVDMTAVTITGLPDWEEPATFAAAREAGARLGVDQVMVTAADVERVFRLRGQFVDAMNQIVSSESSHLTMVIGHQVLRRMLEEEARSRGAGVVAFGFNADDLVSTMVTWFTSGFRMGGIPAREIGGLRYVFPLYRITKKELTLYLELVAPELNRQGTPGRFTTGPDDRSMSYALTDHLFDLWPGIDYYLFAAFQNMQRYMFPLVEATCRACGGTYLPQEGVHNAPDMCDVCDFFARRELSTVSLPECRGTKSISPRTTGPTPTPNTQPSEPRRRSATWPGC